MSVEIIKKDGVYHITTEVKQKITKTLYDPLEKAEYIFFELSLVDQEGNIKITPTRVKVGGTLSYKLHTTIRPQDIEKE